MATEDGTEKIPAGKYWCDQYPTGKTTASLVQPFRKNVQDFITHLETKHNCKVTITATLRPYLRAFLMRQVWDVIKRGKKIKDIPVNSELNIEWTLDGIKEMFDIYKLVYRPSLTSRHILGKAIDMNIIGWEGTLKELEELGASFGVYHLSSDFPHWSTDGK